MVLILRFRVPYFRFLVCRLRTLNTEPETRDFEQIKTNSMNKTKIITLLVITLTVAIAAWVITGTIQPDYETTLPTAISVDKTEIDMGILEQGKPQTVIFKIKNTGEQALFIKHVESSCGCTVPEWTKKPVKPGSTAKIKVTYDAVYPGRFIKQIRVFCNAGNGFVELRIKGEVSSK